VHSFGRIGDGRIVVAESSGCVIKILIRDPCVQDSAGKGLGEGRNRLGSKV